MNPQPSSQGSPTRFFDLPAEIRLQIYYHCLVHASPISISAMYPSKLAPPRTSTISRRTVLLLCRQTYHEAADLIYKYNNFQLSFWDNEVDSAPSKSGGFDVSRVRHLELVLDHWGIRTHSATITLTIYTRAQLLTYSQDSSTPLLGALGRTFNGLESLVISCKQPDEESHPGHGWRLTLMLWLRALEVMMLLVLAKLPGMRNLAIDDGGRAETIDVLRKVFPEGYKKTRTETCDQYYRRGKYDDAERVRFKDEALELMNGFGY